MSVSLRSTSLRLSIGLVLAVAIAAMWWLGRSRVLFETLPVTRANVESTVTAIGTLQPRRYVDVGAQVSGQINRLLVTPGSEVKAGDLLVEIDPSVQRATVDAGRAQLASLRAQLAEQTAQHRLAEQQFVRMNKLINVAVTLDDLQTAQANVESAAARIENIKAQIEQTQATLKADEARLGYTRIYAPMAGTVVSVEAREGQTLNATYQTPNILRIADLSGMTVWTDVSEADVRRIRSGMPVYFTTLGSNGEGVSRRWQSTVRQVLPAPAMALNSESATPATATKAVTYTVLFDVQNHDGELMPQMTAQVVFVAARVDDAIAVPLNTLAANDESGDYTARIIGRNGKPETRALRLGVRSRHSAEVLEGLVEGESLIIGESHVGGGPKWLQW
ncbi:MAG: efflux RND transporter periplasmic adaptor subunit [Steroidobacteraceae bacterium]